MAKPIDGSQIMKALVAAHGEPVYIEDDTLHIRCMLCGQAFPVEFGVSDVGMRAETTMRPSGISYEVEIVGNEITADFHARARHDDCPGSSVPVDLRQES